MPRQIRILCAPDSFKGSLSAVEAAQAMATGIRRVLPDAEVDLCPVADGGEGTVAAMIAATQGELRESKVMGPRGEQVRAHWGLLGDGTAVVEMAAASGLTLVPVADRNPMSTTTYGTGQLLTAALDAGAPRILLGLGGSATNDGGCGMAMALGVKFLDKTGALIEAPIRGELLLEIERIDVSGIDPRLQRVELLGLCDVQNPMTGPAGAARTYGTQKGATAAQVQQLDTGLAHLAEMFRQQLRVDVEQETGAGAAGGMGGGLLAFLGARLRSGIEMVLEHTDFDRRVHSADLCLTGEGRLDGQSTFGKACIGVARAASRHGVRTVALVGSTGPGVEKCLRAGLHGYEIIGQGVSESESMSRAADLLVSAVGRVVEPLV
jgi:glycerate kinase